jgi:hypothetical protein
MTHRRQTIRSAFASAVTGLPATASRVYVSRLYALQPDELPALRIFTESDGVEGESIGVQVVPPIRRVRVVCEVVAKANAAADDAVDAICEQMEAALVANPFLSGAVLALRYQGFEQQLSVDGDQQVVVGRLTFEATAAS